MGYADLPKMRCVYLYPTLKMPFNTNFTVYIHITLIHICVNSYCDGYILVLNRSRPLIIYAAIDTVALEWALTPLDLFETIIIRCNRFGSYRARFNARKTGEMHMRDILIKDDLPRTRLDFQLFSPFYCQLVPFHLRTCCGVGT